MGVTVSKLSLTTTAVTGDTPQNINFAIKLQLAKEFMSTVGLEHAGSSGTEKFKIMSNQTVGEPGG